MTTPKLMTKTNVNDDDYLDEGDDADGTDGDGDDDRDHAGNDDCVDDGGYGDDGGGDDGDDDENELGQANGCNSSPTTSDDDTQIKRQAAEDDLDADCDCD